VIGRGARVGVERVESATTRIAFVATARPARLHFTGDDEADALLAEDPLALLVGFELDQQVPLQKAFSGPLELKRRLGGLDAREIAGMDAGELDRVFREKPALHRYPGTMAERTQALCAAIASEYDGDAARVWNEAESGADLQRRLLDLPGIGPMKAHTLVAILVKRFGVRPPGWEEVMPSHHTLADVDSRETLEDYQEKKRAYKASLKAARAAK
jgi:uncharacterized HhH-GPD family protein